MLILRLIPLLVTISLGSGLSSAQTTLYVQMRSELREGGSIVQTERIGGTNWPPTTQGVITSPHPDYPTGGNAVRSGHVEGIATVPLNFAKVTYGLCEIDMHSLPNGRAYATVQYTTSLTHSGVAENGAPLVAIVHLEGSFSDGRRKQPGEQATVSVSLVTNGASGAAIAFSNWESSDNNRYLTSGIGGKGFSVSRAVPIGSHVTSLGLRLNGQALAGDIRVQAKARMTFVIPDGAVLTFPAGVTRSLLSPTASNSPPGQSLILLPEGRPNGGRWTMHFIAPPGTVTRLQRSEDLQWWTDVTTRTLSTGVLSYDATTSLPQEFYRLAAP